MSQLARTLGRGKVADGYKPQIVPKAYTVIQGAGKFSRLAKGGINMGEIDVVTVSFTAVGTIHTNKNFDEEKHAAIPKAIETMKSRLEEICHRTGTGMMIFGPEAAEHPQGIWKVAAEVTSIENVPNGMISIELPEMQYAHIRYSGAKGHLDVYDKLIAWIHKYGDYGNGAMIERWENSLPFENEHWEMHLYIPFEWKNNTDAH